MLEAGIDISAQQSTRVDGAILQVFRAGRDKIKQRVSGLLQRLAQVEKA